MYPTYTNPLYPASLPDPYVLKYGGEYWAYGSEKGCDGRYFKILHSLDLLHWQEVGGALDEQPGGHTCYWAPEVVYWNGYFYLYYSLGNENHMTIRVASAPTPGGPFEDSGLNLTLEPFAIDAHVFEDDDGSRYLFYATDFLDHPRAGTGIVFDRLLDPFTLAGYPRPVTRARFDWQIFDPHRQEKGGLRWHTLEGPFVLKHKGCYTQMFSGGNWQNTSYGVGYAVTTNLNSQEEWEQACNGQQTLPILRSLPEQGIIGPGHNSAVRGPDNRQWFCIYHRWAPTAAGPARVMAADRLEFIGGRVAVLGPSSTPQPTPIPPTRSFFLPGGEYATGLPDDWHCISGNWQQQTNGAVQTETSGLAEIAWDLPAASFLLEVTLQPGSTSTPLAGCGLRLADGSGTQFTLRLLPEQQSLRIENSHRQAVLHLPYRLQPGGRHLLRLEVNHLIISISLDGCAARWQGQLRSPPTRLSLLNENMSASFSAFQWTAGWEDNFDQNDCDLTSLGWIKPANTGAWTLQSQQLCATPHPDQIALLHKLLPGNDYEIVLNARLEGSDSPDPGYGFGPLLAHADAQPVFSISSLSSGWVLVASGSEKITFPLPDAFDPSLPQQFRLLSQDGQLSVALESQLLGSLAHPQPSSILGLSTRQARAWFDLVRVTTLPDPGRNYGEIHAAT